MTSTPSSSSTISREDLQARKKLLPGALNLIGAGTLGFVNWFMVLVDLGLNYQVHRQNLLNKGQTEEAITRLFTWQVGQSGVFLMLCLFVAWAGFNALVASRRKTVIAGALVALVPFVTWFGCVFGIIGGLWVLWRVMRDEGVRKVMGK